MKFLTSKYFILGNLLVLLIAIPVTLFFIKKQQDLRSRAAPSSKLYFTPESPNTSTQCQNFSLDVMVDPGNNFVSIVDFYIKYDPTKLDVLQMTESSTFQVVRPSSIVSGAANMSVSIGSDITKAVQTISKVATITFRPKVAGTAQVLFDSEKSRVFSLSEAEPTENVLFSTSPANVNVGTGPCLTTSETPSPTLSLAVSPTTSLSPSPSASPSPTTSAASLAPVCTELSVSPSATGAAPFSVLFTAKGNDPDATGVIAKTTFNFGDGKVQDVTDGMNLKSVTVQTNHTFQTGGTFGTSVTFTDDKGMISQSCIKILTATGGTPGAGTTTPTPTGSGTSSGQLTATPTTAPTTVPTIPPSGNVAKTLGIIGAVLLTIIGGFLLLAL